MAHHHHDVEVKKVEELSATRVKVTISFSAATVADHEKMTARQYANSARIPGFRPGKAPVEMVLTKFKDEIRRDLLSHLVDAGLQEGLVKAKVEPLSRPKITFKDVPFENGKAKDFVFDAEFDVPPKIELKKYKGVPVKAADLEVKDEEIAKTLENLQDRLSSLEPSDEKTARKEAYVSIEVAFEFPEVPAKNEPEKTYTVQVGTEEIFPELDAAILSMSIGDSKSVEAVFPKDHQDKAIAGQKVIYKVKLLEIKKRVSPALDDAFAAQIKDGATLEQLKADIRANILSSKEQEARKSERDQILDYLTANHKFEVPATMVEGQTQSLLKWMEQDMKRQGMANVSWKEEELKEVKARAEKMVRGSLLLREIAQKESIALDEAKVQDRVTQISVQMNRTLPETEKMLADRGMLDKLRDEILTDAIFDFLVGNAEKKAAR